MPSAIDDSLTSRVTTECPEDVRNVLYHAWGHDLSGLKTLLHGRGKASAQDPTTGETPLHAAIRACGPAKKKEEGSESVVVVVAAAEDGEEVKEDEEEVDGSVEAAKEILQELFFSGAIWNDVDANNETPGCVADRLGHKTLYDVCVDAGVRAELLFALMDGYEELDSGEEEEEDADADADADEQMGEEDKEDKEETVQEEEEEEGEGETEKDNQGKIAQETVAEFVPPNPDEKPVTSEEYLKSTLTYDADKLLDSDLNGVMMAWETDIMRRSVAALIPDSDSQSDSDSAAPGKRILNIGFGMGIIDGLFSELKPSRHHIIEAHPDVLAHKSTLGFGSDWEDSGPAKGAYKVLAGKWQDVALQLLNDGEIYDAIYFDTFGEDYAQLKDFFTEYVPGLLDGHGRFSFFNGLGADRKICYDVYARVVEMHCADAGLDVEWQESDVDMSALNKDGKGEWTGVRRRYWTLDKYRLPICTFMG